MKIGKIRYKSMKIEEFHVLDVIFMRSSQFRMLGLREMYLHASQMLVFHERESFVEFCGGGQGGVREGSGRGRGGVKGGSGIVKSHGDPARARQLSKETKVLTITIST